MSTEIETLLADATRDQLVKALRRAVDIIEILSEAQDYTPDITAILNQGRKD